MATWLRIIIVMACLGLVAGGGCQTRNTEDSVKDVGIVLFGDSRQPQVDGFIEGMKALGYRRGETIRYYINNAKNNRKQLKTLVSELIDKPVDLLVAAGGLEADTMRKLVGDHNIPVVVLYVNAIIERGLVDSRLKPGWEVTGVDNLNAELSGKRVELLKDLLPGLKKLLVLYYPRIDPSRIGVEEARKLAIHKGVTVNALAVNSRDDIRDVMAGLKAGDVDAMLTVPTAPIDNALEELILPRLRELKIPLMTHSRHLAEIGGLAAYGAHFYDMGYQAARLADKVFKGIPAGRLPFETPKSFVYTINERVLKELNIELNTLAKTQVNEMIH